MKSKQLLNGKKARLRSFFQVVLKTTTFFDFISAMTYRYL